MRGYLTFFRALKQKRNGLIAFSGCMLFVGSLYGFLSGSKAKSQEKVITTEMENVDLQLDHVSRWTSTVELESKSMKSQLSDLKEMVHGTDRAIKEQKNKPSLDPETLESFKQGLLHDTESLVIEMFSSQKQQTKSEETPKNNNSNQQILETAAPYADANASDRGVQEFEKKIRSPRPSFGKVVVGLRSTANRVKAGDTVTAKLLGGVVVSTGVKSAEHPKPIVLEITDSSNLPEWFSTKTKKCRVIGACIGSISDERVYIRLETLSCSSRDGFNVWEQEVDGWVTGEDGRAGVRGTVIIRDRELMLNSLLGGVLGGAASSVGQMSGGSSSFNPLTGDVSRSQSTKNMLAQAGGQGASTALDRYAKYYIDRAEMLQPVIQVSSNRTVDIIFKKGAYLKKVEREESEDPDINKHRNPLNDALPNEQQQGAEELINSLYEEKNYE